MIKKLLILLLFFGFSFSQELKNNYLVGNWVTPNFLNTNQRIELILMNSKTFYYSIFNGEEENSFSWTFWPKHPKKHAVSRSRAGLHHPPAFPPP